MVPELAEPVIFRGGPYAGEIRALPEAPRTLRVPSFTAPRAITACDEPSSLFLDYEIEMYELHPNYGDGPRWQYIWVNPATALRKRIRELTTAIENEKTLTAYLREQVDDLAGDAANWRSLKALHAALEENSCT